MAVRGIRLEAEDADTAARLNDVGQRVQLGLRVFGGEMREEDAAHLRMATAARGGAAVSVSRNSGTVVPSYPIVASVCKCARPAP